MRSVASRLMAVQSPVIPVIGALVQDHPGTISLGQGVVNYGPPPECMAAIQEFFDDPENHKYKLVDGIGSLRERIIEKLADENGIQVGNGNALVVTAGGNMAFLNALMAIADPGDEIIPDSLLDAVKKIQDTNLICPPVISQFAATAALAAGRSYCDAQVETIRKVRELVRDELKLIESFCETPPADGAFYFFLKLNTNLPPMKLVEHLVKEYGVAAIPGDAFGYDEQCALRISYGALTPETAVEGIHRLTKGLGEILGKRQSSD